jgi:hypothetical protein
MKDVIAFWPEGLPFGFDFSFAMEVGERKEWEKDANGHTVMSPS